MRHPITEIAARPPRGRATLTPRVDRFLHWVLNLAPVVALKTRLRDAMWLRRGRRLLNPDLPAAVRSVLFVCQGNICRSPFAAARAEQLLEQAGVTDVRCASAGILTTQANRSPREACEGAAAFGLALDSHVPVQLMRALIAEYDLVVVMEAAQMELLHQRFEEARGRVLLLPLFDGAELPGYARFNIADPFGQPTAEFERCYRRIDSALQPLVDELAKRGSAAGTAPRKRRVRG